MGQLRVKEWPGKSGMQKLGGGSCELTFGMSWATKDTPVGAAWPRKKSKDNLKRCSQVPCNQS